MFNNLIESSSHTREFKRRGSFVLLTAVTYSLLFVVAGVISIYAYDARLEDQNTEIVVMLPPVDLVQTPAAAPIRNTNTPRSHANEANVAVRRDPMATPNRPDLVPENISARANTNPPVPDGVPFRIGDRDTDPVGVAGPGRPGTGIGPGTGADNAVVIKVDPPPVPPVEKPKPKIVHKSVINSQALLLPKPPYPSLAKRMGIQGTVSVQVLIDESGTVVSAKTISGSAMLSSAAQQAAYGARFSPTKIGDQAVKVSGVITYNFVLQ